MSPLEITILGIPIGYVIFVCGVVALSAFVAVLCTLTNKVEELTLRITTQEYLLGELVSRRVNETLDQGVRSLNELGRS